MKEKEQTSKKRFIRWQDLSLTTKVLEEVLMVTMIIFVVNLVMYLQVNRMVSSMSQVYVSNVSLGELSETLDEVQNSTYSYLQLKTSESLERYYRSAEDYQELLSELNQKVMENPVKLLEKNIRAMSETYLAETDASVTYKRGRNVEKYRESFEKAQQVYRYLNSSIYDLNNYQFHNNSENFTRLQATLRSVALFSLTLIVIMMSVGCLMLYFMVRGVVSPLTNLAITAKYVGEGDFNVKMPQNDSLDEVGVMTRAFNTMVSSLEDYVNLTRENLEKERILKEKELLMEAHLKEAQLKYLQSQINPHFLFNSLNAGAQLAMMEDAEKTSIFLEHMADFFRYNVKKGDEDATMEEEIESVENYIYILNVRFAGDIHYSKDIDETVSGVRMPSMILQPLVENAVNHGIRNIEWEGRIHLSVKKDEDKILIRVRDNGKGMTEEEILRVNAGFRAAHAAGNGNENGREGSTVSGLQDTGDSTGIGLSNVKSRLELYYGCQNLLEINSPGEDQGTEVMIRIPAASAYQESDEIQALPGEIQA
ncbi:MAG: histidine kinase [Blautia sp.]|nr:histidine kinase [Blautia sp.]